MEQTAPRIPTGFLEESPGQYSLMRLMSLLAFLVSIGFGYVTITGTTDTTGMTITLAFLGAAFGGKYLQKVIEVTK